MRHARLQFCALTLELTFGPLQVKHRSQDEISIGSSATATAQQSAEQGQLSDTQAALMHAMQQLEELTESDSEMRNVHAKLEQQSQALQTMQESFEAVEAEKAEEHEQALSRSGQSDMHCALLASVVT